MKKRLLITIAALILCLGLAVSSAQGMMRPEDYGTWLGGDPDCDHSSEKLTTLGDFPGDVQGSGKHTHVIECQCGAQFAEEKECSDSNSDNICDACNAQMPAAKTDLADATVTVNTIFGNNTEYYTGEPITPSVTVVDANGVYMYEDSDYSVSYENNNGPGIAKVNVTATNSGRLKGKVTIPITVKAPSGNLSNSSNKIYLLGGNGDGTYNYTGSQIKPDVMVELDDSLTLYGDEYSVSYGPNTEVGRGSVTVTGNGKVNYGVPITGTQTVYFKIIKQNGDPNCPHTDFTYVSDGMQGHHFHCNTCGYDDATEAHDIVTEERVSGGTTETWDVCGAAGCGYAQCISIIKDLDQASFTGVSGSGPYTEDEVSNIGLSLDGEQLREGEDYSSSISKGSESWTKTFEPIEGKSKGGKEWTGAVAKYKLIVNYRVPEGYTAPAGVEKTLSSGDSYHVDTPNVDDLTPDKSFVEGKITNSDVTETVTYVTCTHPEYQLRYEEIDGFTHRIICGVCGLEVGVEDHPQFEKKGYVPPEQLPEGIRGLLFNGAYEYRCPKCDCLEYRDSDTERCIKGENHDWPTWEKLDEENCHRICRRCKLEETKAHRWSEWAFSSTTKHFRACADCHANQSADHGPWTNISVSKPKTCVENAHVTATCSVCQYERGELYTDQLSTLDNGSDYIAEGHDFEHGTWQILGGATVTDPSKGQHCKVCPICGAWDVSHELPHNWGAKTVVQAGECENSALPRIEEATCADCGAKLKVTTQLHHNEVRYPEGDIAPTCTEFGKEAYQCTNCHRIVGDAIQPLGHDMQIVEKVDATCLTEGYIKRKCSRCDLETEEILKTLGGDGKHHFVPVYSQQPTCTQEGRVSGEKCENCPAEQAGETGYGTIPALGHLVTTTTVYHGKTRHTVGKDGRPIEIDVCTTVFSCTRCNKRLGGETFTIAKSIGKLGGQYLIEPGKNYKITDMENGIHINGNMSSDGGVYFNGVVQEALEEVIDTAKSKYTYKKTEANSFIIEFTDEFLNGTEDGEYEVIVINGSEYWPMVVTVKDHRFKDVRGMETPDMPELTEEEYDALISQLEAEGEIIHRFILNQPSIEMDNGGAPNADGNIVVTKNDGDYDFEALVNGEYTLQPDQDYTLDGDTVTIKAEYLNGLDAESQIIFHYAEFPMDGAPLPHAPKLTVRK